MIYDLFIITMVPFKWGWGGGGNTVGLRPLSAVLLMQATSQCYSVSSQIGNDESFVPNEVSEI